MKAGDKVKFTDVNMRRLVPEHYPPVGTIGTVTYVDGAYCIRVQWLRGSTSDDDRWYCNQKSVELVEEADPC